MRPIHVSVLVTVCFGLIWAGCSPKPEKINAGPPAETAQTQAEGDKPAPASAPAPQPTQEASASVHVKPLDIPECDNFIMRHSFCAERGVDGPKGEAMVNGLVIMVEAWRKAAATDEGRAGMPLVCQMVTTAAAKSFAVHRCPYDPTTGVLICDEYLMKYSFCLKDKVPEASQNAMEETVQTMVKAWREAAATPAGRKGLADACKAALDSAKRSMSQYGCVF
jgi:hypothetical protein